MRNVADGIKSSYVLVSCRVVKVIPALRGYNIRHCRQRKHHAREWPPCSSQPHPSRPSNAAVHKREPRVLFRGTSSMSRHCSIHVLCSRRYWVRHRYQPAILYVYIYLCITHTQTHTFIYVCHTHVN